MLGSALCWIWGAGICFALDFGCLDLRFCDLTPVGFGALSSAICLSWDLGLTLCWMWEDGICLVSNLGHWNHQLWCWIWNSGISFMLDSGCWIWGVGMSCVLDSRFWDQLCAGFGISFMLIQHSGICFALDPEHKVSNSEHHHQLCVGFRMLGSKSQRASQPHVDRGHPRPKQPQTHQSVCHNSTWCCSALKTSPGCMKMPSITFQ